VARTLAAKREKFIKVAMTLPLVLGALLAGFKALTKLAAYMDNAVKEEDIELYGEYIATDAIEKENLDEDEKVNGPPRKKNK